ncbi:formylglycine-generating enzyme family protein [Aquabacter spiritensis]|uniref:Formylglycine-generating enzyme required for sulfatase activity n=1 Tax=Aquabacter spiritensis TaxID=933073 RepID=A0A4R3M118_9HYPH|nr:formylglycine-generating enzyme family protein [Aquabacter spiritensis]TCT04785.1 formylglycine-generating enzyme required for sulfatase activity [Aquabacter spiritensis]
MRMSDRLAGPIRAGLCASLFAGPFSAAPAAADARLPVGALVFDADEVTIAAFARFARATGRTTAAEQDGGGHEWGAGWERRPGWTFRTPFGAPPDSPALPAVHVTWYEADAYCRWAGGRLPTRAEWTEAAYVERRAAPPAEFVTGQTYPFPTGATPDGANGSGGDPWPRLAPAGATKTGVNGLRDMGGNAWEWLADRQGDTALTAGGSWWYGPDQMRAAAMQWKPAAFAALYIGFRCVYPRAAEKAG